jgi:hypothetical protein
VPVQAQVQVQAAEPAAVEPQGPVAAGLRQAHLPSRRTYRKNGYPPPMEPHTRGRPAEQPVPERELRPERELLPVQELPQAQTPPGPTPRRSYRRTTHRLPPTPHRRGRW